MVLSNAVIYQPAGADSDRRRRRRILLYSHDGGGLGHVRIMLGVGSALAHRLPEDTVLLLTGSNHVSGASLPETMDFVKLPSMPHRGLYVDLPGAASPPSDFKEVLYFREQVAYSTITAFNPDLLVVDHAPGGLFRELARSLAWIGTHAPTTKRALLMRDITFGTEQTKAIWSAEGAYPLMDNFYDRILVYGSQEVFDPIAEYGMSAAAAAKTEFVGYLTPRAARRTPDQVRHDLGIGNARLIAVSAGGGADGMAVLKAFVAGFAAHAPADVVAYVVTGPMMPAKDEAALRSAADGLPNLRLVSYDDDFLGITQAADVVVGMGGYNSMTEAVFCGKRAVTVPRVPGPEEQVLRVHRFDERGLLRAVLPSDLSSETLWAAVNAELESGTSIPLNRLPFGGQDKIVDALVDMLGAEIPATR